MTKWPTKEIKTLGRVVTGKTPPKNEPHYFDGDELFVSPKDLDWDQLYVAQTKTRVSAKALEKFRNQVIPRNAVMFTSLSFAFGKVGIASRPSLTNQQINSIVVNGENDFRFVYYLLRACTPFIFAYNSGIDTPIVPKSVFERIKVHCPELRLQERIAAILWTYDELIENNKRRIALLEKMAEEIYREWFVRLRFPGHEKVKLVKGVPEGWTNTKFSQFCSLKRGYDLPESRVEPGPYPVIASTSIKTYHSQFKVNPPVITTGRSGSLGRVLLVHTKAWPLNTALYVSENFGNSPFLIYYTLKNMGLENFNAGAGVPTLNRNHLAGIRIIVANKELQSRFDEDVSRLHRQAELLRRGNQSLACMRDALLPRLMSRTLSVENLDIQFPPSMAEELRSKPSGTAYA